MDIIKYAACFVRTRISDSAVKDAPADGREYSPPPNSAGRSNSQTKSMLKSFFSGLCSSIKDRATYYLRTIIDFFRSKEGNKYQSEFSSEECEEAGVDPGTASKYEIALAVHRQRMSKINDRGAITAKCIMNNAGKAFQSVLAGLFGKMRNATVA